MQLSPYILDKHKKAYVTSCVGGGNDWYFIGKFARRRQHGVLNQELGGLGLNSGFAINFLGDFELKFPHYLSDNSNSLIS